MSLVDTYNTHPYEPLVPKDFDIEQKVFKFNSPQHFISYVQGVQKNLERPRGSYHNVSESTGRREWFMSDSLDHAYEVLREAKFTPEDNSVLERKIAELKRGTQFAEDGYELDIPEHLAGSERVWLQDKRRKTLTRIIDDTLIIDTTYSAGRSAQRSQRIGMAILEAIYRRRVIPRKMVVGFGAESVKTQPKKSGEYLTAIDVSFSDLNGVAKILHPSAFRRLWFRLIEQYPDVDSGYGRTRRGSDAKTVKGYISVDRIYELFDDKERFEQEIDTFLGLTTNK